MKYMKVISFASKFVSLVLCFPVSVCVYFILFVCAYMCIFYTRDFLVESVCV